MIDINRMVDEVALEFINENIRDKRIIYTILQTCIEDQFISTDLATKIIGFVKEARRES